MDPLNSPLEVGMRTLVLLSVSFPQPLDVAQMVYMDDAILHSGDLDGPPSLHPTLPAGPGELALKRARIEQGMIILLRAGLAEVEATRRGGLLYRASEKGTAFVELLEAPYIGALSDRAEWIVHRGPDRLNIREATRAITDRWTRAFNSSLTTPGADHG
ncbi:ABC-three component system middle component 2 [Streptomyces anulatus]|uniref:ABC-three component system middle component 2 n=1 Tax=Streptomyces anulatus TaxID=1892 RepID=UPI00366776CB